MQAFAPGSVTAIFAPLADGTGSRGVSFAVEDGVTVDVVATDEVPLPERPVSLDGEPTAFEPVERALDALGVAARVDLRTDLPIGCGFGTSGAATLATALAANEAAALGRSREDLVAVAHEAEVAAGTGLGDVFIQAAGGLLYDVGNGRERVETDARVQYESYGGIATGDVLGDEALVERIRERGGAALADLRSPPTLRDVVARAWPFAREVGLASERVVETVERVEADGGAATMAMLGETVVGVEAGGVLTNETRVATDGARVLRG